MEGRIPETGSNPRFRQTGLIFLISVSDVGMTGPIDRRDFVRVAAMAGGSMLASGATAGNPPPAACLPDLPYGYDALEPVIDADTMRIHHGKHHAGYVAGLNAALSGHKGLAMKPLADLLAGLSSVADESLRATIRNTGGGHSNHSMFWQWMRPPSDGRTGVGKSLSEAIRAKFGSMENFEQTFTESAMKRFGSGWAWLIWHRRDGLKVVTTPNQDSPLMRGLVPDADHGVPLLGIDVWEHAYYLRYQNRRADYVQAWWRLVNWSVVSNAYSECLRQ